MSAWLEGFETLRLQDLFGAGRPPATGRAGAAKHGVAFVAASAARGKRAGRLALLTSFRPILATVQLAHEGTGRDTEDERI